MNSYKKPIVFFLLLTLISLLLASCTSSSNINDKNPLTRTEFLMGTTITISIYDNKDASILDKAFNRIAELEDQLSINKTDTLLDEVNKNAGIKPTKINDDMFKIISKAIEYSKLTGGSFDITVGPIVKLWNIGLPEARVPSDNEIKAKVPLIGYSKIKLNESEKTVYLKDNGMIIDLGGIAKGYTADVIANLLKYNKVNNAIIDLGGNIYALGSKPSGSLWNIGIQDPFSLPGDIIGYISEKNKSVVTSGIYERYIEKDGKKYQHILNPFTGYPYDNEIAGITIISEKSVDGDALSTSVFSKGLKGGIDFVNSINGIEAIFITKDKKVYLTEGLNKNFVLNNKEFEIVK